jgi:hypothetical protein
MLNSLTKDYKPKTVVDMPTDVLAKKGEEAKAFALNSKNNVIQAKKILDFCKTL